MKIQVKFKLHGSEKQLDETFEFLDFMDMSEEDFLGLSIVKQNKEIQVGFMNWLGMVSNFSIDTKES